MDAWREGLRGIEADSIALAIATVSKIHPDWPPTLGEFVALCKPVPLTAEHRLLPKLPERQRDQIPPEIRAEIDRLIAKIRAAPSPLAQREPGEEG